VEHSPTPENQEAKPTPEELAANLTDFEIVSKGGSIGKKCTAQFRGKKVFIKVDFNYICDSDNALSGESEFLFFKWISETFGDKWPEEIIEPIFFGSLQPIDSLYKKLDRHMFVNNFAGRTNVTPNQENMFVAILPWGKETGDSDFYKPVVTSFVGKLMSRVELAVTEDQLLWLFHNKLDHNNAKNSITLVKEDVEMVKMIDFGDWGKFVEYCRGKEFFHPNPPYCRPALYDKVG